MLPDTERSNLMNVSFDDFAKLDIRMVKVLSAERIEGTDKLLRLNVDTGSKERTVVAGLAEFIPAEHFVGKMVPIVANLEPRTIRGVESRGMVLAVEVDEKEAVLLLPEKEVPCGSVVR